jgi:hypothetical protein
MAALAVRRWMIVLAPVIGAALTIVAAIADPAPGTEGRELVEAYAANPASLNYKSLSYHFAYTLWLVAALGIVLLVRGRGAWLANLAGLLAILGISTIPGFLISDFIESSMGRIVGVDAAMQVGEAAKQFWAFKAMQAPGLMGLLLALPLAIIAAWRAGLVPWWAIVAVIAGKAAFLGFSVSLPGNVLFTVAFAALTLALAKIDPAIWYARGTVEGNGS